MFRLLWKGVSPSGLSVIICEREDGKKPLGLIDQFLTTQEKKNIAPVWYDFFFFFAILMLYRLTETVGIEPRHCNWLLMQLKSDIAGI